MRFVTVNGNGEQNKCEQDCGNARQDAVTYCESDGNGVTCEYQPIIISSHV